MPVLGDATSASDFVLCGPSNLPCQVACTALVPLGLAAARLGSWGLGAGGNVAISTNRGNAHLPCKIFFSVSREGRRIDSSAVLMLVRVVWDSPVLVIRFSAIPRGAGRDLMLPAVGPMMSSLYTSNAVGTLRESVVELDDCHIPGDAMALVAVPSQGSWKGQYVDHLSTQHLQPVQRFVLIRCGPATRSSRAFSSLGVFFLPPVPSLLKLEGCMSLLVALPVCWSWRGGVP